ncbi:MAG: hypothetical protein WCR12_07890 [Dysgonamonadaceae bacterium]
MTKVRVERSTQGLIVMDVFIDSLKRNHVDVVFLAITDDLLGWPLFLYMLFLKILYLLCKRAPAMKALLEKIGFLLRRFVMVYASFSELLRLISREITDL